MKTLKDKDIDLCTHSNPSECFHYIHLIYKADGATIQLPSGYPPYACDHCKWMLRDEDFYSTMLED